MDQTLIPEENQTKSPSNPTFDHLKPPFVHSALTTRPSLHCKSPVMKLDWEPMKSLLLRKQ